VPRGLRLLAAQRLDVLLGIATHRPPEVRAEVVRLEPALVGMAAGHPLAGREAVPVAALAGLDLLLPSDDAAREWNEFVETFCRQAGFAPRRFAGVTHGSVAAAEVVRDERCVVPTMAWTEPPPGLVFRPLVDPAPVLAWSVMWLAGAEERPEVQAFLDAARAVHDERGWSTGSDAPP
jgi:DNA-binding transcriptional LysR family regulator